MTNRLSFRIGTLAVSLCLLMLCLLLGCGPDAQKSKLKKAIPVTVAAVTSEDVPYILSAVGNVTPLATVEIKSRVGGIIDEQLVRNGQDVQKGDLLFRIDPRPFDLAIKEAQAMLGRDRAHLNKAHEDLRRYSKLREMNVVAQDQYDNTYAQAISLENTIRLNEAALEKARLDREYAFITAPIPGRVGIVQVNVGNVIKANDDRTLCVINQIRPINVSFSLPERYLTEIMVQLAKGPIRVSMSPSGTDIKTEADLTAVDNTVDTSTGTIRLIASYPNTDNLFWPGQFARVQLTLLTLKDALLLPTGAILQGIDGAYVYVVTPSKDDPSGGTVTARNVVTSHIVDKRTVIKSGIKEGELVILDGQVALSPGATVSIRKSAKTEAANTTAGNGKQPQ